MITLKERRSYGRLRKRSHRRLSDETSTTRVPLDDWLRTIEAGSWQHFVELKESFRSADYVKGHLIFDIKGNDFRLITLAVFQKQQIVVVGLFTHAEYDQWCKNWFKRKRKP